MREKPQWGVCMPKWRLIVGAALLAVIGSGFFWYSATRESRIYRKAVEQYHRRDFRTALEIIGTLSPEFMSKSYVMQVESECRFGIIEDLYNRKQYGAALVELKKIPQPDYDLGKISNWETKIAEKLVQEAAETDRKAKLLAKLRTEKEQAERETQERQAQISKHQGAARIEQETARTAAQNKFKTWAKDNLAVTDIAINSSTLFVTLSPEKYTSKENCEQIARTIARYYCIQTGERFAVCRIYWGKQVFAKGEFSQ